MARQAYPRERMEVLIVDDGGETPLDSLVEPFKGWLDVRLLRVGHMGPSARNAGAEQAQGEFLAFTADDCAPSPDWLQTLAARFVRSPDLAIGGKVINALEGNAYSTATHLIIEYLFRDCNADFDRARFFTPNNFAVPAEPFRRMGGFNRSFVAGEDRDFCDRWTEQGGRMSYAPEAVVWHAHALSFRSFCRHHFAYGKGSFHFRRERARRTSSRAGLEPMGFYLGILRFPLSRVRGVRGWQLAGLVLVSQLATAAAFGWERLRGARLIEQGDPFPFADTGDGERPGKKRHENRR
jgi:GT2 family glycosyltransferase